jgi:hypothetical protein
MLSPRRRSSRPIARCVTAASSSSPVEQVDHDALAEGEVGHCRVSERLPTTSPVRSSM